MWPRISPGQVSPECGPYCVAPDAEEVLAFILVSWLPVETRRIERRSKRAISRVELLLHVNMRNHHHHHNHYSSKQYSEWYTIFLYSKMDTNWAGYYWVQGVKCGGDNTKGLDKHTHTHRGKGATRDWAYSTNTAAVNLCVAISCASFSDSGTRFSLVSRLDSDWWPTRDVPEWTGNVVIRN